MRIVENSYPELGVIWARNLRIPMRDGITLAADVCRPDEKIISEKGWSHQLPAVLEYMPYRKGEAVPGARYTEALVRLGYVVVRVDLRGTGDSEGITTDEYLAVEQLDGYDTVEWIAAQPWCDGQVSIMGLSYGGFTALQIACLQPPHLRSIIPIDFTDDRYSDDCHYEGGLLRMYYDVAFYGNMMVVYNALPPMDSGLDAEEKDRIWEQHLRGNEPYILEWLAHQTDGPYWHNGSVSYQMDRIKVPVFLFGGWRDGYPNPPLRLYQHLSCPRKAIIGPWNHAWPDKAIPGPRIDFIHEVGRWLDYWCKGAQTGIMEEPSLQVFIQEWQYPDPVNLEAAGTWRAETNYPPFGSTRLEYYLSQTELLHQAKPTCEQRSIPYHAGAGIAGGLWSGGIMFGLPEEQSLDEAHSLQFDTPELDADQVILGRPALELYTSSTAAVMGYVIKLSDINEEGTSVLVTKGALNSSRSLSLEEPGPVPAGKIVCLKIDLDATGYHFKRGHRIRLSITHADFPNLWPTPESGVNTIFCGGANPSRLTLPLIPTKSGCEPVIYRPSNRKVQPHLKAEFPPVWETRFNHLTGTVTHRIGFQSEIQPDPTTCIWHESQGYYSVDPLHPAAVSAEGIYTSEIRQPGSNVSGRSCLTIRSTDTDFNLTIDLEIYLNADLKYHRKWEKVIPRNYL